MLLVGCTDAAEVFHPVGIAPCSNEKEADFEWIFREVKSAIALLYRRDHHNPSALIADCAFETNSLLGSYLSSYREGSLHGPGSRSEDWPKKIGGRYPNPRLKRLNLLIFYDFFLMFHLLLRVKQH